MKTNHLIVPMRRLLLAVVLTFSLAESKADDPNFASVQAAAEKGDAKAQYELAICYAKGKGVPADAAKAAEYLRKAADQGYANAQTAVGSCYGKGLGVPKNFSTAVEWYRKAAAQGDSLGQYCLGACLLKGSGVATNADEGLGWWRKAAESGLPDAQCALGLHLMNRGYADDTNHVNYVEAAQWLQKAADQGYVPAMNNLGFLYKSGLGVKPNTTTALKWYRLGAEQDDPRAQANLGLAYEYGSGVRADIVEAYKWYLLSAQKLDTIGKHQMEDFNVRRVLTTNQIAEARQRANEFRASLRKAKGTATDQVSGSAPAER
jgi:TPR repeat protein